MLRRDVLAILAAMTFMPSALAQTPPAGDLKPTAVWGQGAHQLRIATGSPGELGLLEAISIDFARRHDATVLWYRAGSG